METLEKYKKQRKTKARKAKVNIKKMENPQNNTQRLI